MDKQQNRQFINPSWIVPVTGCGIRHKTSNKNRSQ